MLVILCMSEEGRSDTITAMIIVQDTWHRSSTVDSSGARTSLHLVTCSMEFSGCMITTVFQSVSTDLTLKDLSTIDAILWRYSFSSGF